MRFEMTSRVAKSIPALEQLLASIEQGRRPKPDWIHLQAECRLETLGEGELDKLLARIHGAALRGFRTAALAIEAGPRRLALWRRIASRGFHDFSSQGFTKCYDSPFVESYDYVAAYLAGGISAIDPFAIYSAVLGSHDYGVEDFVHAPACEKVETIVEPMAGTGEFAYAGHFRFPEFRYVLFDLDADARDHVMRRRWLPGTDVRYEVANVLDPGIWRRIARRARGQSLSFIGKQSHHFFGPRDLSRLLQLATTHTDHLVLEVPEAALVSDLDPLELLTRPEMEDAGFETALVEDEEAPPNPFTNELGFRLDVWDANERRTLFDYRDWTSWQPPMLVSLARLLDLEVSYLCDEERDFISVDDPRSRSEDLEHVSFMRFRAR